MVSPKVGLVVGERLDAVTQFEKPSKRHAVASFPTEFPGYASPPRLPPCNSAERDPRKLARKPKDQTRAGSFYCFTSLRWSSLGLSLSFSLIRLRSLGARLLLFLLSFYLVQDPQQKRVQEIHWLKRGYVGF